MSHPHIVKMYGVCLYPLCMVTEFVPNGDLFKYLQTEQEIPWRFKLKMALDIAKGMQYLHSISPPLIHRYVFIIFLYIIKNKFYLFIIYVTTFD